MTLGFKKYLSLPFRNHLIIHPETAKKIQIGLSISTLDFSEIAFLAQIRAM
jgi:hypothetical protein